jgi:hypothetical protein
MTELELKKQIEYLLAELERTSKELGILGDKYLKLVRDYDDLFKSRGIYSRRDSNV